MDANGTSCPALCGLLFEPFGEVPPQRLIVELQQEPCQQDVAEEQSHSHRPCLREGEFIPPHPGIEEVHEGVVHHVERVGDIAQELAGAGGSPVGRQPRSTQPYQHGEEDEGAEGVVEAVQPVRTAVADVGHGEEDDDGQAADPEGTPDAHRLEDARHQQPCREGEEQAQEAPRQVGAGQRPAYPQVAVTREAADGIGGQSRSGEEHQHFQRPRGEAAQEERVEDVADVLEEERPAGTVEREHLTVAPHLGTGARQRRDQEHVQQQCQHHQREGCNRAVPHLPAGEEEGERPQQGAHHHHRLQADQSPPEEILPRHLSPPAVVVGIPHHEAGEDEEEVHRQVAVVELLVVGAGGERLEDMVPDHHDGCHAAQPVQDAVMRFGVCECCGGDF